MQLVGDDGPRRFAVTASEAEAALDDFIESRLGDFGPFEDAMLGGDWTMAHSLLSVPLNLGLLDPRAVVERVAAEHGAGRAPLASVEGFVRQIAGWRDYIWHLYWHLGESYRTSSNHLSAHEPLPAAFRQLDAAAIESNCLRETVDGMRRHGWAHHIQRLMVLGNWALQHGYDPVELNDWFIDMFVDGTPWGHAGERDRDVAICRRWHRRDQAVRVGRGIYQQDVGLLRIVRVLAIRSRRPDRVPVHGGVLGVPGPCVGTVGGKLPDGAAARRAEATR